MVMTSLGPADSAGAFRLRAFSFPAGMPSDLGVARGWRCADAASGRWALAARSDDAFGGESPCGVFARDIRALAACLDGTRSRVCRAASRGASRREKPTRGGRKRLSLRVVFEDMPPV